MQYTDSLMAITGTLDIASYGAGFISAFAIVGCWLLWWIFKDVSRCASCHDMELEEYLSLRRQMKIEKKVLQEDKK